MAEKLDGWRVVWTGARFITREGNVLDAPDWFKAGMPETPLDGELFAGRGMFNSIQTLMANGWHGLTYQIFDAPAQNSPFRARIAYLRTLMLPPHAEIVPHIRCRDTEHLIDFADAVVANGGEGAVIRDPRAKYIPARDWSAQRWVPQCPSKNRISGTRSRQLV
jgi:DNA ligase-1